MRAAIGKVIWIILAAVLAVLTVTFAAIQAVQTSIVNPILIVAAMTIALIFLFFIEGAEIAVVALLDKDPEQIPETTLRVPLTRLQDNPEAFFTGRQLLVVALIVFFTVLTDQLSAVQQITNYSEHFYDQYFYYVTSPKIRGLFSFALPTFTVLWFSQLLPKFLAQQNPLQMFSWTAT